MVHVAFSILPVLTNLAVRVESATIWKKTVLIGGHDGSLWSLNESVTIDEEGTNDRDVEVTNCTKSTFKPSVTIGFSKRPITQLDHLGNLIFALSENVSVGQLPQLKQVCVINRSYGAHLFSLNRGLNLICIAVKRKLLVYKISGANFSEVREVHLPDTIKCVAWSNDSIIVAFKSRKEYWTVHTVNGTCSEISTSGRSAPPLVASLPNGDVLLGKDYICVIFCGSENTIRASESIHWSEPPVSIAVFPPYILARLSNSIEIRSLNSGYPLVQTLPLSVTLLKEGELGLVAASESDLYLIVPRPIIEQVEELSSYGDFEAALSLCKNELPEEEMKIRMKYGAFLLEDGSYEEAMHQFSLANGSLRSVLMFFPQISLPESIETPNLESKAEENGQFLTGTNSNLNGGELVDALRALVGFLADSRIEFINSSVRNSKNESEQDVVSQNHINEAKILDTALLQAILILDGAEFKRKSTTDSESGIPYNKTGKFLSLMDKLESEFQARQRSSFLLSEAMATKTNSPLIYLVGTVNFCDVNLCERKLINAKKFLEVVLLYQTHGMHRKALEFLINLDSDDKGIGDWIPHVFFGYLKDLGEKFADLVLEYSVWILKRFPTLGLRVFTEMDPPLSLEVVLDHLKIHAPSLKAIYLEHFMEDESTIEFSSDYHDELVHLKLRRVLEERTAQVEAGIPWDETFLSESRTKLISVLQRCSAFRPAEILRLLPKDAFHSERALLLGKLNEHRAVLLILARKLRSPEKCIEYCDLVDRLSLERPSVNFTEAGRSLFTSLVEVYLKPSILIEEFKSTMASIFYNSSNAVEETTLISGFSQEIMFDEALDVLTLRWQRLDPLAVASLIPNDTPLGELMTFLEPFVKDMEESVRRLYILKSVYSAENQKTNEKLDKQKRRSVKITDDRICDICGQKIGSSVFGIFPNDDVAHFACIQD